jgi:hypothetical protein
MNIRTIRARKKNLLLFSLLLALAACGDENGSGSGKEEPDLFNVGDYVMMQCTVYYNFPGGWTDCRDADLWSLRPNQPVFTALSDCLIAKGHEQDEDPTVWDDTQEDRDRGWATLIVCSIVVEG